VQHRQLLISQKRELVADLKGVKGERDLLMQQLKEWQTFAEEAGECVTFSFTTNSHIGTPSLRVPHI
jgi:hypothetical protein